MTIHVELSPEAAARLLAEAGAQGIPLEKVAERLLHEALASRAVPKGSLTPREFRGMPGAVSWFRESAQSADRKLYPRELLRGSRLDDGHALPGG
jgi:hypothetical protein